MFLLRISFWLAMLAAVLWLWPASRLALFLVFQGGGRDGPLALFGLAVCGTALLLSVIGGVLTREHEKAAAVALGLAAVIGALSLFAVALPLGSIADLAAGAFALVVVIQGPEEDSDQ